MAEPETTNFVCVQCWKAFTYPRVALKPAQESVVCPHCGEDVPIPPDDDFADEHDDAGPGFVIAGKLDDERREPPPTLRLEAPIDPSDADLLDGGGEDDGSPLDPETVVWKLLIPGGLTYNFHGIGALIRWSTGKRNLNEVAVSLDGVSWRNFGRFAKLIEEGTEARQALDEAGEVGEAEGPGEIDVLGTEGRKTTTLMDIPLPAGEGEEDELAFKETSRDTVSAVHTRPEPAVVRKSTTVEDTLAPDEDTVPPADRGGPRMTPPVTGQFTFNLAGPSKPGWVERLTFVLIGIAGGLGLAALLYALKYWNNIFP